MGCCIAMAWEVCMSTSSLNWHFADLYSREPGPRPSPSPQAIKGESEEEGSLRDVGAREETPNGNG